MVSFLGFASVGVLLYALFSWVVGIFMTSATLEVVRDEMSGLTTSDRDLFSQAWISGKRMLVTSMWRDGTIGIIVLGCVLGGLVVFVLAPMLTQGIVFSFTRFSIG